MNRVDNTADYQLEHSLSCADGSSLLLARAGEHDYLLLPAAAQPAAGKLPHSLLAQPVDHTTLAGQDYACYLRDGQKLLSEIPPGMLNDKEVTGIACDIMEALLQLQLNQLALPIVDSEHILIDAQQQIQLLGQHAAISHDTVQQQQNLIQAGRLLYWLYSGRRYSSLPLASLRPQLDNELLQLCQQLLTAHTASPLPTRAILAQLQDWLVRQQSFIRPQGNHCAALEQLLQRMRHSPDFPALSQAVSAINHIGNADSERLQVLAEIILKDFSLTNKLLKVVNSANFSQFGGTVSTVSRAIVILGFDTIRNLALTLLLFEHMHNRSHAQEVRDVAIKALFCGLLARNLARHSGLREAEEALICGMFQQLGELLCVYYFRDEYRLIHKKISSGSTADQAVLHTLGLSYAALGAGTVSLWSFPESMISSLEPYPAGPVRQPQSSTARLRMLGNLAQELTGLLSTANPPSQAAARQLLTRYERASALDMKQLDTVIEQTQAAFDDYLREWSGEQPRHGQAYQLKTARLDTQAQQPTTQIVADDALTTSYLLAPPATASLLSAGIQDITLTLLGSYQLNDLLRMILEIMFRAVGFDHVVLCTKDPRQNQLQARFGFGPDIPELLKHFRIDLDQQDNAFCIAMERNVDIFIEDASDTTIASHIPGWYRQLNLAQTFIIFPLVLEKRKIGFLYGDKKQAHSLPLRPDELNLLKTLRNQALLAIRQKQN
ncbi:HDOD domain-containing protein [Aquitalea palustris]|uniref:HDOD domain-containing protein n=1 Tax=Aquitalea palustris TaxID=2480983 RepID=A0A454JEI2_9NEIS|nr:HDOD domain-containing protein [Aquitalea palustris]RMC93447.1 HDOD domain-containing protein [Aquitalea palustris]